MILVTKYSMKVRVVSAKPTINRSGLSFWLLLMGYLFGRKLEEEFVLGIRYECDILEETRFTKEKLARIKKRGEDPATMDGMSGCPGYLFVDLDKRKAWYIVNRRHDHVKTSPVPPTGVDTYIWY